MIACSAVMIGARSFAAIGRWARNDPWDALARPRRDGLRCADRAERGDHPADANAACSAVTGAGLAVTQLRVPDKTNEITCFDALLAPYGLTGDTVTADDRHCRREHARFLVERKKGHHAFTVKRDQKNLHLPLAALPWPKCRRTT
ncbi:hypothetical protein GCM10022232_63840 [Streptomyces plumbiresistens]|uniref:Transposase IS4-like domain-containing protein n=2 Tax=Streptomyces plumbiresistens TaxID=511811 RepID=A0ABP7SKW1_9ACTN